jgi:hypothetical protein
MVLSPKLPETPLPLPPSSKSSLEKISDRFKLREFYRTCELNASTTVPTGKIKEG